MSTAPPFGNFHSSKISYSPDLPSKIYGFIEFCLRIWSVCICARANTMHQSLCIEYDRISHFAFRFRANKKKTKEKIKQQRTICIRTKWTVRINKLLHTSHVQSFCFFQFLWIVCRFARAPFSLRIAYIGF